MLKLLGCGTGYTPQKNRRGKKRELGKNPPPSSSIQQMKDIAGMPDMPNAEFVAWFRRTFNLLESICIVNGSTNKIQQPAAPVVFVSGNDPSPAA